MDNHNFIIINTTDLQILKENVRLWLAENESDFIDDCVIKILQIENNIYEIATEPVIENSKFLSLFRSLSEYYHYKSKLQGFITANDEKIFPANFLNQNIYLELSENPDLPNSICLINEGNQQILLDNDGNSHPTDEKIKFQRAKLEYFNLAHPVQEYKITKDEEYKIINDKIRILQRLGPISFDIMALLFIGMIFLVPLFFYLSVIELRDYKKMVFNDIFNPLFLFFILGMSYIFSKDSINGQSIGKRVAGMQVIDKVTGNVATPMQCLVRNLFVIMFPIELIYTLFSPNERLGDKIAKTRLIPISAITLNSKIDLKSSLISIFVGFVIFATIFYATINFIR